jgi:hypothetical protein
VKNVSTLREQISGLARQLGTLRPYFEALSLPTVMGTAYAQWDAYNSAVSNDVAVRKGASIEAILPQLEQALGRLESLDPESEFELKREPQRQSRTSARHEHLQRSGCSRSGKCPVRRSLCQRLDDLRAASLFRLTASHRRGRFGRGGESNHFGEAGRA